jgi:hypothetical protein
MDKRTWTAVASSPQRHETCSRPPFLPGLHTAAQSSSEPRLPRWNGRTFSQLGADGMIWKLFEDLGTTNRFFVEFGTQDGLSCNSRTLRLDCGWDGLMMDGGVANPGHGATGPRWKSAFAPMGPPPPSRGVIDGAVAVVRRMADEGRDSATPP